MGRSAAERAATSDYIANNLAGVRKGPVVDYNGSPFPCRSWIANEWNAFKIRFKQMVEVGWNNQILLLPTDDDQDHRLTDESFVSWSSIRDTRPTSPAPSTSSSSLSEGCLTP